MDRERNRNKSRGGILLLEEQVIKTEKVKRVIHDDKSLLLFMRRSQEFIDLFCGLMVKGTDFTLRLEARGNKGIVLHVQTNVNDRESPDGAQKRIDGKSLQNYRK